MLRLRRRDSIILTAFVVAGVVGYVAYSKWAEEGLRRTEADMKSNLPLRTGLLGHANYQPLDLSLDPRPAGAPTRRRAIEFARHQLAVPGQDRVRSSHVGHLGENFAAQSMTNLAERGSLGVCEL
jgi:hypothetical protein